MKDNNQIFLIKKFLNSSEETIIINQVNEELGIFYLSIIKYYSDQQGIRINVDEKHELIKSADDLFGLREIKIFNITNTKKLSEVLNVNNKKIIFTDYKNYKKLNSKYNCINGYKFEHDINFFIKNELNINDAELLYYCKNNPVFLFSETAKYLINNRYVCDQAIYDDKNHILDIRKLIFEIKKNDINIKNLYLNIKKEAEYKKLNFLIY